jgi:hypothetical protein
VTSGCDRVSVGGDSGTRYIITNRCDQPLIVEFKSGSDPFEVSVGESRSVRTLDEEPGETFVVRASDGTGVREFTPLAYQFQIVGSRCPSP